MARRILSATDYGFRKVIRVVMDDSIPQWIHPSDGDAGHTAGTARRASNPDGSRGDLDPTLQAGTECHSCVFNHDLRDFNFTREELQVEDPPDSGSFRNKTDLELVTEIQLELMPARAAAPIATLENQVI